MLYQWLCLAGAVLLFALLFWQRTRIHYRITGRHVKVTLLGITLRRVALTDIECVTKRRSGWAENWWSTWRPFRRTLILRRRRGWRRDFVITPRYRYEFRSEVQQAIRRAKAAQGAPAETRPEKVGAPTARVSNR
jgi:hypothetical protein